MIEDLEFNDDYYTWSDNPKNDLLAIDSQPQESDASIELDDSEESSEEELVFTLSEERFVDLMIQFGPAFKSYVKMMLEFSQDKQIVLITLIDMRVVLSIIYGKKLSRSYISQLLTDFLSLIALFTFHPEGFGYIILNHVDNKPHFFHHSMG